MKTCVEKRNTIGAPGEEAMKKVIAANALLFAGKLIVNDSKSLSFRVKISPEIDEGFFICYCLPHDKPFHCFITFYRRIFSHSWQYIFNNRNCF